MNEIRNLLPDPKPVDASRWGVGGGKNLTIQMLSGNRLHITNNADINDSYAYLWLTNVPAGVYRFGAEVSNPQTSFATNMLRMIKMPEGVELAPARWDGVPGRIVTPPGELTEDTHVELRVMVGPQKNSAIWVRQLFVMKEEDYQQMLTQNIEWFDGDSHIDTPPPADWIGHLADRHHLELEVAA